MDASRLTGEPVPVSAHPGIRLLSGSLNLEGPLTLRATAPASESQYARIVELVRTAQASKSPLQRLADRYAVWFTPLTLAVCAAAYLLSGDPTRVLAVLVVATPCPLILATPVAVVGGINRAARRGIIFRHGTALEQLGRITRRRLRQDRDPHDRPAAGRAGACRRRRSAETEVLRLAGGVEHGLRPPARPHVVQEAAARGIVLPPRRSEVTEAPGQGVTGVVGGPCGDGGRLVVRVHRHPGAEAALRAAPRPARGAELRAYVAVDGRGAGVIEYADRLRPELAGFITELRRLGVRRIAPALRRRPGERDGGRPRGRHRRGARRPASRQRRSPTSSGW